VGEDRGKRCGSETSGLAEREKLAAAWRLDRELHGHTHEENLAFFREQRNWSGIADTLVTLGHILLDQGDVGGAVACFEEGLPLAHKMRDMEGIAWNLEGQAAVGKCTTVGTALARVGPEALAESPLQPQRDRRALSTLLSDRISAALAA